MATVCECETCGTISQQSKQICHPRPVTSRGDYCGKNPGEGKMCVEMKAHLAYVCGSCGRPAEQAEVLCDPLLTG